MKNKLLRKQAFLLATSLTLGITSLTGCGNNLKYGISIEGSVIVTGSIEYDNLKKAKLVRVKNDIAELDEYYLVLSYHHQVGTVISDKLYYKDIETGEVVYSEQNKDYKNFTIEIILDGIVDYLYKYNMIKDKYNIDDIERIKQNLLSDDTLISTNTTSKNTSRKKLIKTKKA